MKKMKKQRGSCLAQLSTGDSIGLFRGGQSSSARRFFFGVADDNEGASPPQASALRVSSEPFTCARAAVAAAEAFSLRSSYSLPSALFAREAADFLGGSSPVDEGISVQLCPAALPPVDTRKARKADGDRRAGEAALLVPPLLEAVALGRSPNARRNSASSCASSACARTLSVSPPRYRNRQALGRGRSRTCHKTKEGFVCNQVARRQRARSLSPCLGRRHCLPQLQQSENKDGASSFQRRRSSKRGTSAGMGGLPQEP